MPECLWTYRYILKTIPDEVIKKIFKGWIKAVTWSKQNENWGNYQKILNARTYQGFAPYSEKELKKLISNVKIHAPHKLIERNKNGGGLNMYLEDVKKFLKNNDMLKRDYQINDIFDNRLIMDVLNSELPTNKK